MHTLRREERHDPRWHGWPMAWLGLKMANLLPVWGEMVSCWIMIWSLLSSALDSFLSLSCDIACCNLSTQPTPSVSQSRHKNLCSSNHAKDCSINVSCIRYTGSRFPIKDILRKFVRSLRYRQTIRSHVYGCH